MGREYVRRYIRPLLRIGKYQNCISYYIIRIVHLIWYGTPVEDRIKSNAFLHETLTYYWLFGKISQAELNQEQLEVLKRKKLVKLCGKDIFRP